VCVPGSVQCAVSAAAGRAFARSLLAAWLRSEYLRTYYVVPTRYSPQRLGTSVDLAG
jgi:hypothetical protein